ncbi:MAG: hypothetical protein Ta2G_15490 [Termitinemataceae bacterium]|nr:MAG: hypothetical protein Ta2G_15490 [Termitinemataceae bacterium]
MNKVYLCVSILFVPAIAALYAQPLPDDVRLHQNALRMHIVTRIIDGGVPKPLTSLKDNEAKSELAAATAKPEDIEPWSKVVEKITIPGKPVSIKIMGDDIVLVIFFTVYPQQKGKGTLTAQGQVWIQNEGNDVQYKATSQYVPLEFGKTVLFYPIGEGGPTDTKIEIQVSVFPHNHGEE